MTPMHKTSLLGKLIFASRWLQVPLYLGLIVAQGVYVVLFLEELWHLTENFAGEGCIFSLFWIDRHPRKMPNTILRRSSRFEFADLAKVVDERFWILAIEAGPECGFGDGHYAAHRHTFVVLCGSSNGVVMRLNDLHKIRLKRLLKGGKKF